MGVKDDADMRSSGRQNHVATNPRDTTAFDLRTLEPSTTLRLDSWYLTFRKERKGWGTRNAVAEHNLDK